MRAMRLVMAVLAAWLFVSSVGLAASIKVTVNGAEITDTEIAARAGLMRLERRGTSNSDRLKLATTELIDEQLMLQEAQRIGISVTNAQVDEAFLNVARNIKLSSDKLSTLLVGSGVNPNTLKDRLRANIAWNGVVQHQVASQVKVSDLELEKEARAKLQVDTSFDYILKEIRFIIPKGSNDSVSRRTADANQYRKSFQGCDNAVQLSMSYTDAAVLDIGRRHATQLPPAIALELSKLNVGGITKPRVADGGVSMLAICDKASSRDTTFIKSDLRQQAGNDKFKAQVEDYLKKLHDSAAIVYR